MKYENRLRGRNNQAIGKGFEKIFIKQAHLNGLLCINHPIGCFTTRTKVIIRTRSDLDFEIIEKPGLLAKVDTKCFDKDYFTLSEIDGRQLELSIRYMQWGIESGFVVWFRPSGQVSYFSASIILHNGPRFRFTSEVGLSLGIISNFDLKLITAKAKRYQPSDLL